MSNPTYSNLIPPGLPMVVADQNNLIVGEANCLKTLINQNSITSAQLLALKSGGGVILVPAPTIQGSSSAIPGIALMLESVALRINFGGTAYTLNAGTLKLFLGPPANNLPLTADLSAILTQTANADTMGIQPVAVGPAVQANIEGQPIYLGNTGTADFTLGNGTLDVVVNYMVVQM